MLKTSSKRINSRSLSEFQQREIASANDSVILCVRERERERKALGQADKHDGNPQHISGNTNNNSNKEQPHRQAVHVMHHLEARIRCSTSSPSTSAAASGAASSFTCLTLSHFFALLEVVAGCSECCAFFLEFGAMTRH